ncbi:hypothetical protein RG836_11115 [Pseudomonas sp. SZMC_28357]|uniref:hypothetical protein n=1 Tax=Pseudomonas sp. SZMC_28357 TaxID=3074380 RepID=UPI002871C183|nr:hypothetical protein [Pseudomonas sp. SZMC_28357]MDR9751999.1 hypothetical protein [Pseudomonas sp. SZMC_28357]
MTVQTKKEPAPLALLEPEIPGRTEPDLPSGAWRINKAAALDNFPEKGLKVHILPWGSMDLFDKVELLFNGNVVDQHSISEETEVDQRVTLWVAPRHFTTGEHSLTYRVTRRNQGPETLTPPIKLYVKLELPGGQDLDPVEGQHSELHMFIAPEIVNGGVDKEAAEKGVDIKITAKPDSGSSQPYPNIAVGDVCKLSWGGWLVYSDPVTAQQISNPIDNPILITVDAKTISDAGDTGVEGLAVTFMIRDLVHNESEDWCKETRIEVDTGNTRLEAPVVDQANGNVLDLDALGDDDVHIQVWAVNHGGDVDFALNDTIIITLRGVTQTGSTFESRVREVITKEPPLVLDGYLLNQDVRALAKSQASISYEVERNGSVVNRSKTRFVNIVGEAKRLDAPLAEDALDGAIDPDLPSTRIRIPFDPVMKAGMVIELKWLGSRPDGSTHDPALEPYVVSNDDEAAKEDLFITVDGWHLKTLEGGSLDLSYNLLSVDDDGEIITRSSRHAPLLNVGEPQYELVKPIVLGEQDGALEPDDLPNGASKLTAPRPITVPTKARDKVTYFWSGEVSGLKTDSVTLNALIADRDVPFTLTTAFVAEHIEPNRGKQVTVRYEILRAETGKTSYSNPLTMIIGTAEGALLPPAKVLQAPDGVLDPANAPSGATVQISANREENVGDHFYMKWQSTDELVTHEQDKAVTSSDKGKPVEFTVPFSTVLNSRNKTITLSYRVELSEGGEALGEDYTLRVEQQNVRLPVPWIREAKGDQLNPDGVYPNGATVVIGASAELKTDDEVIVQWDGKTTQSYPHTVLASQQDKELDVIKIPYAVVNANDGGTVSLTYTIKRKTGATDGPSLPAVYDVRKVIGSGQLKIMGARFNRSTSRASGASRMLSAFNAATGQALQAEWQYEGDDTWQTAATWRDTAPHLPLRVRTADDLVTLNPANIIGNGNDTTITGTAAFVAHRDVGDVTGWGNAAHGATIPSTIITLDDVVEVSCTGSAYAARRANGAVVAWGTPTTGGTTPTPATLDYAQVVGNSTAFAALKKNASVSAWGTEANGGKVPEGIGGLRDIQQIVAAGSAFAAIRDVGQVVAWGLETHGAKVPDDIGGLTDIREVLGSSGAFAAYRANGRIVGWGHENYGAKVPDDIAAMTDIIELSCANTQAFVARRATEQVVAWGTPACGGTVDPLIGTLTDIVEVSSTWRAFAARRGNGHVVAWGTPAEGGNVPADIATLDDIVQVVGSSQAFAALRKNGTVVAWGNEAVGGSTAKVIDQLSDVRALYANTHGFTALTVDGRVVTWGHDGGGGDSSAVQDRLAGKVSYHATPATRGLALQASRWLMEH